mmetsp:Transcript_154513/g.474885  ORF Transcript_154513/g.474885 Transcript_154513/m.474885 type:complete len:112 (-) Transcript_154513:60-395(-)
MTQIILCSCNTLHTSSTGPHAPYRDFIEPQGIPREDGAYHAKLNMLHTSSTGPHVADRDFIEPQGRPREDGADHAKFNMLHMSVTGLHMLLTGVSLNITANQEGMTPIMLV